MIAVCTRNQENFYTYTHTPDTSYQISQSLEVSIAINTIRNSLPVKQP